MKNHGSATFAKNDSLQVQISRLIWIFTGKLYTRGILHLFYQKWKSISLNQKIFRHKNISFWSKTHLIQLKVNFLPTQIFPNSRLPKPNPILIFHFREKDQFQSASSINLPHPLVTSSLGTIGGNPLGTSLGTSSLHSQPSFEPFQPFKKWFISGDYIHATYSKWFISNTTWRMCTPLYMCLIVTLHNLETLIGPVSLLRLILRSATKCYGMISCYDTWSSSKLSHRLFCVSSIWLHDPKNVNS